MQFRGDASIIDDLNVYRGYEMRKPPLALLIVLAMLQCAAALAAGSLDEIVNYREYSPTFSSAGQPDAAQLGLVRAAGFERVVYIAYSDQEKSLANEDRVVKSLGMEYVHIPVEWGAPTASDFALFRAAMQSGDSKRTLLHCQVNYRASAFSFLYRVIVDGVPLAAAKADMNSVWTPNETWRDLIFDVLENHDLSPHCEGCDWSIQE